MPGEADDYCVILARDVDNAVMVSADGDFLVYAGEAGSFSPLQTFSPQVDETVTFTVFSRLRERLGLKHANGLVEVAALLREEVPLSIPQCLHCVNRKQTLNYLSRDILDDYVEEYVAVEEVNVTQEMQKILGSGVLFGRLTELFFSDDVPTFWLPLMPTCDPPRRTPWEISRFIRQAAYYDLRERGFIKGDVVVEMVQCGQRVARERVLAENVMEDIDMDKEQIFVTAITILFENVSDNDCQYLPYFAGMFVLIQQELTSFSQAQLPPAIHYIALQYQTIIYSLLILLQCRFPTSLDIPEFVQFWDFLHFTTAITHETSDGKELWNRIIEQLDPSLQERYNAQASASQTSTKKAKKAKKLKSSKTISQFPSDPSNRFSSLATEFIPPPPGD